MKKRQKLCVVIPVCFLILCCVQTAETETIVLPAGLVSLAEEAFAEDAAIAAVELQPGILSIGDRCFRGCEALSQIVIPDTVETIGADCFSGCPEDLLIITDPGSAGMLWAQENHMDFHADTQYRALLIAQLYRNCTTYITLTGPEADVDIMEKCLTKPAGTLYRVFVRQELTASGILDEILACFGSAQAQDVSLFFYSGHGAFSNDPEQQGALVGADGKGTITASALRQALDQIPGRKIIILDSCYSGSIIRNEESGALRSAVTQKDRTAMDFLDSFTAAFSKQSRSADYYSEYFILTAAAENEQSYEDRIGSRYAGLFTANLANGLGYSIWRNAYSERMADANHNGVVTIREAYQYTRNKMITEGQHVQVYPADCGWLGLIR